MSPGRPEEEGIRPVDGKARRARRAEGGGRRGGTGGGVTRRPAGRNLRDLRVAAALRGRAQGGGPGPRGRARGEPEPGRVAAWEPGLGTRGRRWWRGARGSRRDGRVPRRNPRVDLCPPKTAQQGKCVQSPAMTLPSLEPHSRRGSSKAFTQPAGMQLERARALGTPFFYFFFFFFPS